MRLTPGFWGREEAHIGHDRHNGQGAKGRQIIHDKQQQIFSLPLSRIPPLASLSLVLFPLWNVGNMGNVGNVVIGGLVVSWFGLWTPMTRTLSFVSRPS